jgi:hypothetical protein
MVIKERAPKKAKDRRMDFKRTYTSRRTKNYEDNDSNGEDNTVMDTAVIQYKDTLGRIMVLKPNPKFKPYKNVFKNLLKQTSIITPCVVISMIINYTSTVAVALLKKNEHQNLIHMYSLKTYELVFEECLGRGEANQCIKAKEIE